MLDIKRAYHHIPVAANDVSKTAVITLLDLFEQLVMHFGLRNASQTFQRFVDGLFRDLDYAYAYTDDILVASANPNDHKHHVRTVLDGLNQPGLTLNVSKFKYACDNVKFLEYCVEAHGLSPDFEQIQTIINYPRPTTVIELRRFFGMINFYRRNLPHAADTHRHLQSLIISIVQNDHTPLHWIDNSETTFTELKRALSGATVLAHARADAEIVLCTDASDTAIGAALYRPSFNHPKLVPLSNPLAFCSCKLSSAELKYSAHDRKLSAIYSAIEHFRPQLEGREFSMFTDHKPLTYAFRKKSDNASSCRLRQLDFISQFTTDI